jgi:hypothetical protein
MCLFIVLVVVRICVNLMIVCFLDWYEWMMIIVVVLMSVIVIIMIVSESCLLLFYAFIVVADNYNWG